MSWVIEGVHEHEGYVAPIAKDGRDVFATRRDGLVMTRPSDAQEEVLPLSELLGWEARCSCGWVGPMWRRRSDAGFWAEDQKAEPGVTWRIRPVARGASTWIRWPETVTRSGGEIGRLWLMAAPCWSARAAADCFRHARCRPITRL